MREKIVKEIYGSALGGHSGILASYQRLKRKVILLAKAERAHVQASEAM